MHRFYLILFYLWVYYSYSYSFFTFLLLFIILLLVQFIAFAGTFSSFLNKVFFSNDLHSSLRFIGQYNYDPIGFLSCATTVRSYGQCTWPNTSNGDKLKDELWSMNCKRLNGVFVLVRKTRNVGGRREHVVGGGEWGKYNNKEM